MDILNEVNKINTDLYLPATDEESTRQVLENNKWGSILNKRIFKTLSDNDKSIKQILINIANEVNDFKTKKDSILLDIENAKTDIEKLEGLININEQKTVITTGTDNSSYNIKGTGNHLKYNGKDLARVDELPVLPDLSNYVKNDVPNTLTQKLTGTEIKANTIETTNLIVNGKNIDIDNLTSNNSNGNTDNLNTKIKNLYKVVRYDDISLTFVNNGVVTGYSIGNIALFNFRDISPTVENGNVVICKLPVKPLIDIEGVAIISQGDVRTEKFLIDTEGNVKIKREGIVFTYLKYNFNVVFPFNL